MPIYEINTDQGVFEIDADREPTNEEALAAIQGQITPPDQSMAERQVAAGLLGGTGHPMSREAARELAMDRMAARSAMEGNPNVQVVTAPDTFITRNLGGVAGIPTPGQRNLADVSQIAGLGVPLSKARAVSSGSTFGVTDALERLIQDAMVGTGATTPEAVASLGVAAQRAQNPEDELALNIAGGIIPGGGVVRSALETALNPSAITRIGRGMLEGLKGGLTMGVSEAVTQEGLSDPATTLATIPETSIGPVVGGVLLGGGIPAASGLVTSATRGARSLSNVPRALTAQLEDVATDVIKPPKAAKASLIRDLESGLFQDSLRSIEAQGRPTGLVDALDKAIPAVEGLSNRITSFIDSNADVRLSNSDVADEVVALANSKRFRPKNIKDQITAFADTLRGDRTLRDGFDDLNELNELRRAYYQKSNAGQATDLDNLMHEAEQLARDRISRKLDDVYRGVSGNTDNPYQQYGALKGLVGDLADRGNELITDQRIKRSKGPTLEREVLATLKSNAELLTGGELGRIDRRIVDMFNLLGRTPQPSRIRSLTAAEQEVGAATMDDLMRQSILRQSANPQQGFRVPIGQGLQNVGGGAVNVDDAQILEQLIRQSIAQQEQNALLNRSTQESNEFRRMLEELSRGTPPTRTSR